MYYEARIRNDKVSALRGFQSKETQRKQLFMSVVGSTAGKCKMLRLFNIHKLRVWIPIK